MRGGMSGGRSAGEVARELAAALNARMEAAGVSAIPASRDSELAELRRGYDGRPRIVWRSNGASVPVDANAAATEALLRDSHHFVTELERLDAATAEATRLLGRMRAANVRSIAAPRGSAFTRIVDTGHPWGLHFTWRSNGATCSVRGNVHAAGELLRTASSYHAALDREERTQSTLAARGSSALERLHQGRSLG